MTTQIFRHGYLIGYLSKSAAAKPVGTKPVPKPAPKPAKTKPAPGPAPKPFVSPDGDVEAGDMLPGNEKGGKGMQDNSAAVKESDKLFKSIGRGPQGVK